VIDMGMAALFAKNVCWGEHGVIEDCETKSAKNYALMCQRIPSLPPVEELIAHHTSLWPHDWVYCIRVATRQHNEGVADEFSRMRYQLGSGPDETAAIRRRERSTLNLVDLEGLGVESCEINVWQTDSSVILRVCILAIAEQIVRGQQQDGKTLHQVFAELAELLMYPPDASYSIQHNLHRGLHLFSHALAAAATEYHVFPRGSIILFANDTNENEQSSEPAHQVALDGGIALSLGGGPEELLLISHERLRGRMLERPRTVQEFLRPTLGADGIPKAHFIPLTVRTNDRMVRRRALVLGVADAHSVRQFLQPWSGLLTHARQLTAQAER